MSGKRLWTWTAICALALAPAARAADTIAVAPGGPVVLYGPNLDLRERADSDVVEFANGKRVRVGELRKLAAAVRQSKAKHAHRAAVLRVKPAAKGTQVRNATELAQALDRPDSETLELPSGRRLTVAQLKLLRPEVEKRLGRSLTAVPKRAAPTGTAVKVGANPDWKAILAMPDATVLEAPNGARLTVGELKAGLQAHQRTRRVPAPRGR